MLRYKVNVIEELKKKGYNTTYIRKYNIFSQSTLTALNTGKGIGWDNIDRICTILKCQVSDIIEWYEE